MIPTVTVSRSTTVSTAVTVMKMLVVTPSTLVDVPSPPSAPMKPMPPALDMVVVLVASPALCTLPTSGVGEGAKGEVVKVEVWCVMGITTKGS